MRISDWSSDVCSSDLLVAGLIDDIEVVTRAAAQQVVAAPAIEMVVAGSSDQEIVAAASIERVTGQHIVAASDAVGIVGTDHGFEAEQPVALGLSAMLDIGRQVHGCRGRFGESGRAAGGER